MLALFPRGLPIECIHVLENCDLSLTRNVFVKRTRKMSRSEMLVTKQNQNRGVGMRLTDIPNLVSGRPIPHADLTQVFTRHNIEPIDSFRMRARSDQRFVKWRPIIGP